MDRWEEQENAKMNTIHPKINESQDISFAILDVKNSKQASRQAWNSERRRFQDFKLKEN